MKFPRFVSYTHDFTFSSPGRNFEIWIGERFFFNHKAVVSGCIEWVRQAFEDPFIIMMNRRDFAMHDPAISDHFTAKGVANALVA